MPTATESHIDTRYLHDIKNDVRWSKKAKKTGLSHELIDEISDYKNEPDWMREFRHKSLDIFFSKPIPTWGPDLSKLNFEEITFFLKAGDFEGRSWEDVPDDIKQTFDKLGILKAEQEVLAGIVAQYESESIYAKLKKEWEDLGVIYCDMETAVQKYPDLVKKYFMTSCVPPTDNTFAALHGAVWSGGSFVYVPKGVKVDIPLQTYFRMNSEKFGQFEHTLIVAEEDSFVHYIEGCTAPYYATSSLHSAVVEIHVHKGARARYTTIQNWSKNVYNLNTKRGIVDEDGILEWVGGSLGSGVTMLYPCSVLKGKGARADHLNIALASGDVHKDTGAKVIHLAPYTSSNIVSKSISKNGGWSGYRGLLYVAPDAHHVTANVRCDALMLDEISRSDTYPHMDINNEEVTIGHEATVGRIGEEQLFYLMSRGLTEDEAVTLIVNGFIEPVVKELPLEYAVELNRLIELEMEGSIG